MSTPAIPPPPRVPSTLPSPADDVLAVMRELRKALANVGELCVRLDTTLAVHELAILTAEHKVNTAHEAVDGMRARISRIESRLGMAAE